MEIQVSGYSDVSRRAIELDCSAPKGLSILPSNFATAQSKDGLLYESSALEIRKLWRQAKIVETKIEKEGDKFHLLTEKTLDWVGPTIFMSASWLSQNQASATLVLDILCRYIADIFKGHPGQIKVILNFVIEKIENNRQIRRNVYKHIHIVGSTVEMGNINLRKIKNLVG